MGAQNKEVLATPDKWNRLRLHYVIIGRAPLGAIKLITKGYPRALQESDIDGNSPLHMACSIGIFEVVQYLLQQCKTPILKQNKMGLLPLHLLCKSELSSDEEDVEFIECLFLMLLACPELLLNRESKLYGTVTELNSC